MIILNMDSISLFKMNEDFLNILIFEAAEKRQLFSTFKSKVQSDLKRCIGLYFVFLIECFVIVFVGCATNVGNVMLGNYIPPNTDLLTDSCCDRSENIYNYILKG